VVEAAGVVGVAAQVEALTRIKKAILDAVGDAVVSNAPIGALV
jgi:hypothetical protein